MASTGTQPTSGTWHSALNKVPLTCTHTHSHTHISLLGSHLSHQSIWRAITVSAFLCCMLLYRSENLFCFVSGFPLDRLCTPIRFVTQWLWMGLRESWRGRGRVQSYKVRWVGAFKNREGKQECESGQQKRMRMREWEQLKKKGEITVSASKRQVNSWIWPEGLLNNNCCPYPPFSPRCLFYPFYPFTLIFP